MAIASGGRAHPRMGCMGSPETVELAGALSEMAARVASARVAAAHRDGTSVVGTGVTVDGEHGSWEEPIAELVWIRECRAALRLIELEAIRRLRVDRAVRVPWQEIGEALGTTKQAAHHRLRSEVITPGSTLADLVPPGQGLPGVDEYLARHPPLPAGRSGAAAGPGPPDPAAERGVVRPGPPVVHRGAHDQRDLRADRAEPGHRAPLHHGTTPRAGHREQCDLIAVHRTPPG